LCLANKLRSIHTKSLNDAFLQRGNLSLGEELWRESVGEVDDVYLQS
jgi:hypothetical protein